MRTYIFRIIGSVYLLYLGSDLFIKAIRGESPNQLMGYGFGGAFVVIAVVILAFTYREYKRDQDSQPTIEVKDELEEKAEAEVDDESEE